MASTLASPASPSTLASPASPSTNLPNDGKYRGYEVEMDTEDEILYYPGGLLPVHLGDVFKNGRYRVIRKLGYGSFSTVWLAVDKDLSAFVALKIIAAKSPASALIATELDVYEQLSSLAKDDPGSQYVVLPLDTFEHIGPNGLHRCLIFPPMGGNAYSLGDRSPSTGFIKRNRYPIWMAKRTLTHILRGLKFLHKAGIVHSDIHRGNTLFGLTSLASATEASLKQDEEQTAHALRQLGENLDEGAPRYVWDRQPLYDFVDTSANLIVKISDLGGAFKCTSPPAKTYTPAHMRAPEIILGGPLGPAIDIWSFGCLLSDLIMGIPLFLDFSDSNKSLDEIDEDHIFKFYSFLGPFPDDMISKWPRGQTVLKWLEGETSESDSDNGQELVGEKAVGGNDNDGQEPVREKAVGGNSNNGQEPVREKAVEDNSNDEQEGTSPKQGLDDEDGDKESGSLFTLEKAYAIWKPDDISEEEVTEITTLIRRILQYDPSDRPSAEELLKDPWFSSES